jgi:hypothetical protein
VQADDGWPSEVGKIVGTTTTQYVLNLAVALPAVISDTEAIYLYGLDSIAQQRARSYWRWPRNCPHLSAG